MAGLRVGVEVSASVEAVTGAVATLPWLAPDPIVLDAQRTLVVLTTSMRDPGAACDYAVRRLERTARELGFQMDILSTEAFGRVIDLRSDAEDLPGSGTAF